MPLMISLNGKDDYEKQIDFLTKMASQFMVDQRKLDENLHLLAMGSKGGFNLEILENLPFWRYEQFIDIENKRRDEEKKRREQGAEKQKTSNNMGNPGSYLNKISSMANSFKK
jgi:hypothetical protein